MSQKKKSKEERYLIKLYEIALEKGDPMTEVDRYEVAKGIGEHAKSCDHSVQMLTKNNFIKKRESQLICLTDLGLNFIQEHLL